MMINTDSIVSITEANQNFSKVARLVDQNGSVVILRNNVPRYLVVDFARAEQEQNASYDLGVKRVPPATIPAVSAIKRWR